MTTKKSLLILSLSGILAISLCNLTVHVGKIEKTIAFEAPALTEFENIELKTQLAIVYSGDGTTESPYVVSNDNGNDKVSMRFGCFLDKTTKLALDDLGSNVSYGIKYSKTNDFNDALNTKTIVTTGAYVEHEGASESVSVDEANYFQFLLRISNIPVQSFGNSIKAAGFVCVDGEYFYTKATSISVNTLAQKYVDNGDTSEYTEHLGMLNWMSSYKEETSVSLANKDEYCYLENNDNHGYFVIEGTYSGCAPRKSILQLRDENNVFSCSSVEIEGNFFVAKFELTNFLEKFNKSSMSFYPCLYVNGATFDGTAFGEIFSNTYKVEESKIESQNNTLRTCAIKNTENGHFKLSFENKVEIAFDTNVDFNKLDLEDGKKLLKIKCHYTSNPQIDLVKDSIYIKDGTIAYDCSNVELLSKSNNTQYYELTFDITNIVDNGTETNGRVAFNYYPHLYLNDAIVVTSFASEGDKQGDIFNGNTFIKTEIVYKNEYVRTTYKYGHNMLVIEASKQNKILFSGINPKNGSKNNNSVSNENFKKYYPTSLELAKDSEGQDFPRLQISGWAPVNFGDLKAAKEAFEIYGWDSSHQLTACDVAFEDPGISYEAGTRVKMFFDISKLIDWWEKDTFIYAVHMKIGGTGSELRTQAFYENSDGVITDYQSVEYKGYKLSLRARYYRMVFVDVEKIA